jgi:hypothetical protein
VKPIEHLNKKSCVTLFLSGELSLFLGGMSMPASHLKWSFVMILLLLGACETQAAPILVTSRAGLGGTDFVDWSQIGPNFTNVPSPYSATSNLGQPVVASLVSGNFSRRTQGLSGTGWVGNFSDGDAVLYNLDNGTITIDFSNDVAKAGANIQSDAYGAFVARITAFDSSLNALASFTVSGISTNAGNGSAPFLGVSDAVNSIRRITFALDSPNALPNSFGINQFDFAVASPAAVPEPTSLAIFGLGAVGAAYRARRRLVAG